MRFASKFGVALGILSALVIGPVTGATAAPAAVSFAAVEPAASGRVFYVSGTGRDSNSGLSKSQAFRTLQHAADQTGPGDTVYAMNGTYSSGPGTNVLAIRTSGRADAWIKFRAMRGHTPVVKVAENWSGISVDGASYILIEGFTVTGGALSVTREEAFAQLDNRENQRTIANCIGAAPQWDEPTRKPHHLIIRKNVVSYCPGGGIYANQADYVRIDDNVAHHNAFWSPWGNSGISIYQSWNSDRSTATKVFIRRNVSFSNESIVPTYISNPENPALRTVTDGNGIIVDDTRNTQSYATTPGGEYTGRTLIENNLVYDNGGRGINIYSSDHVTVRYNTSSNNAQSADIDSEFALTDAGDVQVRSNIIVAPAAKVSAQNYNTTGVSFSNNIYQGGSRSFPGGVVADPKFRNADAGDFTLAAGSPAIDRGTTIAPLLDLLGVTRPRGAAPDIGAYER